MDLEDGGLKIGDRNGRGRVGRTSGRRGSDDGKQSYLQWDYAPPLSSTSLVCLHVLNLCC